MERSTAKMSGNATTPPPAAAAGGEGENGYACPSCGRMYGSGRHVLAATDDISAAAAERGDSESVQETLAALADAAAFFRKEAAYECENMGHGGSSIALGRWKRFYHAALTLENEGLRRERDFWHGQAIEYPEKLAKAQDELDAARMDAERSWVR